MRISAGERCPLAAILGAGVLSLLVGCDVGPASRAVDDSEKPPTISSMRDGTQQLGTLSEAEQDLIARAIERRFPSSADNYYMVKAIRISPTGTPGELLFVANVDWAGFGPVTARYYAVRGLFDANTRQVRALGELEPRQPPRWPRMDVTTESATASPIRGSTRE